MQKLPFQKKEAKASVNLESYKKLIEILKNRGLKFSAWVRIKIEEELKNLSK